MFGSEKSRYYCLKRNCAKFLAGIPKVHGMLG